MATLDFTGYTNNANLADNAAWVFIYNGNSGGTDPDVESSNEGGGRNIELIQYGYDGGHVTGCWALDDTFPDDQDCQFSKDNDNGGMGPAVRLDSNGDGYGIVCAGGLVRSYRLDAGAVTTLGSTFPTTATADTVKIDAAGTTIERFHNGSSTGSNTDSTHSSGQVGLWTNGAGAGNGCLLDDMVYTDPSGGGGGPAAGQLIIVVA
jgi:hypothetical protein